MLIENLLVGKPEDIFIYLERNVNARFPLTKNFADVSKEYRPDIGADSFKLPFVLMNSKDVEVFLNSPETLVRNEIIDKEKVKLFLHPAMIEDYRKKGLDRLLDLKGYIEVSPTSSTRTVMTRDRKKNFMIKVNLERRLGENIRKVKRKQVEHSCKIMSEFNNMDFPENLGYLPETIGISYSPDHSYENQVGIVVREFDSRPISNDKKYLIPFFSLFSLDKNNREDDPLLAQIVEKAANLFNCSEYDVFYKTVLEPFISSWSYLVLKRAFNPDIHAQNSLLELDENGIPVRIVYRDFQEFFVDLERRTELGLSNDFNRHILHPEDKLIKVGSRAIFNHRDRIKIHYSHTYDYKIGRILDYFTTVLSKFPCCDEKIIREGAKEIFKKNFGNKEFELFPEESYCYPPFIHNFSRENLVEGVPKYR